MPISHEHGIIFVHIPKTGGTSIEFALGMHGSLTDVGRKPYTNQTTNHATLFGNNAQHMTAERLNGKLGDDVFAKYFKFAVVRNPWERLVSLASWKHKSGGFDAQNSNDRLSAEEFSKFFSKFEKMILMGRPLNSHFATQESYVTDIFGDTMVDEVGKLENIEEFWAKICVRIGNNTPLEKRMRSVHSSYDKYYTDAQAALVGEIYAEDCRLFDYRFERD